MNMYNISKFFRYLTVYQAKFGGACLHDIKTWCQQCSVSWNNNWAKITTTTCAKSQRTKSTITKWSGPVYPKYLQHLYIPPFNLQSADDSLKFIIPRTKISTYGDRAFSVIAAGEWNKLPMQIRSSKSVPSFKSQLKTYLFKDRFE